MQPTFDAGMEVAIQKNIEYDQIYLKSTALAPKSVFNSLVNDSLQKDFF